MTLGRCKGRKKQGRKRQRTQGKGKSKDIRKIKDRKKDLGNVKKY